ncbi:MAG: hypothetical protein A2189_05785, partial [Paenibacillus sp. RIFOXYA1_FULL_44_5]
IQLGHPVEFKRNLKANLSGWVVQVLGQKKLLKDKKSGIMHVIFFYGFIMLQFGALDLIAKGLFGVHIPFPAYSAFGFMQELTVALVLFFTGYATYRRYIEKLKRLKKDWKSSIILFLLFFLMVFVLFSLTFERVWQGEAVSAYAPLSSLLSLLFMGMKPAAAKVLFYLFWWLHLLDLLVFLVYVPQSKHFHLLMAPINVILRRTNSPGQLKSLNLDDEDAESFGVSKIEDFTQKQMIDFYACVECGRCTNVCPAASTGKWLSPMHMIVKMRDHLTEKGRALTSKSPWMPAFAFDQNDVHQFNRDQTAAPSIAVEEITDIEPTIRSQKKSWNKTNLNVLEMNLIGDVMTEDEIWACTTCRNCEDQCPVDNEHVDKIIDLRRHLVLMEGNIPSGGQRAMQNIERQGNPWGISRSDRAKWTEHIGEASVPTVKQNPNFEILYVVGSMGSYDTRSQKVSEALVKLMHEAGVNFAILGNEEKNSGDTARRMGNEFLFQQLCKENIEIYQKYNVKKIVTACPHTYNTLKNEYPEFGLEAEVIHHTELLATLIQQGKLIPQFEVKERITYHDSCYLGRYNEVYEVPRNVLRAIPGVEVVEMERNRENGMCCGAGGGMMWMEETGKRINLARTEQALLVEPTVIASACPYCLTMLEDGTKLMEVDEKVKTRDIAEILADSVFGKGNKLTLS